MVIFFEKTLYFWSREGLLNMIKYLLLLLMILCVTKINAQTSFIKKLPLRGVPAKMIATSDGGYACLAATDFVNAQFNRISLIKCDANGDTIWVKKYALNDSSVYFPEYLIEISGVGYIVVSRYVCYPIANFHNGVVLYTDLLGNKLWEHVFFDTLSSTHPNYYTKIIEFNNNTFSVLGGLYPYMFLHTLDFSGNLTNVNIVDTFSYYFSNLNLDLQSNPIITRTMPPNVYNLTNVFKSDASYNHLIDKNYVNIKPAFADVNKTDNGLAYLRTAGDTIIKLDSNLDSLWTHTVTNYYTTGFTSQIPTDFKATADGGYVMCGKISNPIANLVFLLRTDSLANTIFKQVYFGAVTNNVVSVEQAADGGFVMLQSGNADSTYVPEMWLVKTDSMGVLTNIKNTAAQSASIDFKLSPNPARDYAQLMFTKPAYGKLMLYDLTGKALYNAELKHKTLFHLPLNAYSNGLYVIKFMPVSDMPVSKKLIIHH